MALTFQNFRGTFEGTPFSKFLIIFSFSMSIFVAIKGIHTQRCYALICQVKQPSRSSGGKSSDNYYKTYFNRNDDTERIDINTNSDEKSNDMNTSLYRSFLMSHPADFYSLSSIKKNHLARRKQVSKYLAQSQNVHQNIQNSENIQKNHLFDAISTVWSVAVIIIRPFSHHAFFSTPGELIFGSILLYIFSQVERRLSTKYYAIVFVTACILSSIAQIIFCTFIKNHILVANANLAISTLNYRWMQNNMFDTGDSRLQSKMATPTAATIGPTCLHHNHSLLNYSIKVKKNIFRFPFISSIFHSPIIQSKDSLFSPGPWAHIIALMTFYFLKSKAKYNFQLFYIDCSDKIFAYITMMHLVLVDARTRLTMLLSIPPAIIVVALLLYFDPAEDNGRY